MHSPISLVGEEIAGDWNVRALEDIARALGAEYYPYDMQDGREPDLLDRFDCRIAAENLPVAAPVYTFRPPATGRSALLVGNEAKGLRRRTVKRADSLAEVPLLSRNINCLNVAAAAAVMLYYLSLPEPLPYPHRTLAAVQKNRPDLLLVSGPDAMELGSTIRSACAFGWDSVLLEDRYDRWYECGRLIKSQGRGAARRGRNPIRVMPFQAEFLNGYDRIALCSTRPRGRSVHLAQLTGCRTLIVLEHETETAAVWRPPAAWTAELNRVSLPPVLPEAYHYRQMASIVLAEIARQLGRPTGNGIFLRSRRDRYRKEIQADLPYSLLDLEDLTAF